MVAAAAATVAVASVRPVRSAKPARRSPVRRQAKPRASANRAATAIVGSGPQPAVASYGTSQPPSIGRPQAPRPRREEDFEPGDHSHLPAFLLRPVRARA